MTISIGRRKMFLTPWRPDRVSLRCLLVDDNDAFLEAASALLRAEGATVVGVAWSISEARAKPTCYGRTSSWSTSASVMRAASTSPGSWPEVVRAAPAET
jgi:hypothetical protein